MAKKKVQIDKASDFGKYIGKTCITHHTDKGIIVGYTVVFNLFIIGLLEGTEYSWGMVQDEHLNYDIIEMMMLFLFILQCLKVIAMIDVL